MKKHKMLITLAGLVVALATTATVAAYTLAGDGSSPPANESVGTQEPAFQDDKLPIFDPLFYTIYSTEDDKGSVSVTNPNLHGDPEPTHGDLRSPRTVIRSPRTVIRSPRTVIPRSKATRRPFNLSKATA